MVVTKELRKSAVEVLSMLEYCSNDILDKIPKKFIDYLNDIQSFDYIWEYDETKSINEQNFSHDTLYLIGLIYKDYICSEEERKDYLTDLSKTKGRLNQEKTANYSTDNLFKNSSKISQKEIIHENETELVEYKENIFKKFWNKLKKYFSTKKEKH